MGVSLAVVVALVVGLLVWEVARPAGSGGIGPSADDGVDRTVGLLQEKDPVCDGWHRYADELAVKERRWAVSDDGVPAAKWSPEQRGVFESTGEAMSTAADQFESLLPQARSVILQELIAQTIVYLRAYVERIPAYVQSDRLIAGAAGNFSNAVTYMCSAVPLVRGNHSAGWNSEVQNPADLRPFIESGDPICAEFTTVSDRQDEAISGWTVTDSTVPAEQFTPQQRELFDAVRFVLVDDMDKFEDLASRAKGTVLGDLILVQNAYTQAFVDAIPHYTPDDAQLWTVVTAIGGGIIAACEAHL